ncbi:hypothetical protein B0I37DRAFT_353087 [Chaetomium sp. MPI-CAGE-AT-0009]|nr:hypothetical protein B0I37DRAFT_353087 [Chaetomium sp. MPI-CAGE-AT-0009]
MASDAKMVVDETSVSGPRNIWADITNKLNLAKYKEVLTRIRAERDIWEKAAKTRVTENPDNPTAWIWKSVSDFINHLAYICDWDGKDYLPKIPEEERLYRVNNGLYFNYAQPMWAVAAVVVLVVVVPVVVIIPAEVVYEATIGTPGRVVDYDGWKPYMEAKG